MLTQVSIRDVVLIEKLDLKFANGLTVFTGETGAGKSILLDSLGLALGDRARAGLVRHGAAQASVSATFEIHESHPAFTLLQEHGVDIAPDEEPLILRRVVSIDGKSRAFISDRAVSSALLKRLGALLVEIQGQHEQITLTDTSLHRDLLDHFRIPTDLLAQVAASYNAYHAAQSAAEMAEAGLKAAREEEAWLRQSVSDLATLAPQEAEEEELVSERTNLQREERQIEAVNAALAELNPRDRRNHSPATALRAASRALSRLAMPESDAASPASPRLAQGQEVIIALEKAEEAVAEVETLLSRLAQESELDTAQLEATEERLFALRATARKHHVSVAELPQFLADLQARLSTLDIGELELARLHQNVRDTRRAFDEAATRLSNARQEAALALKTAIETEFRPLKLERARFEVAIQPLPEAEWSVRGKERISFLIATNPGQTPGPMGKVASGGELSRIMLALKVVLAARSDMTTLVFDEVDAGVGGATAAAIGERLSDIAKNVQVFSVTHSPQIAAKADHHYRIVKNVSKDRTGTMAHRLHPEERREELARMLAGEKVTEAARGAADSLLGQGK